MGSILQEARKKVCLHNGVSNLKSLAEEALLDGNLIQRQAKVEQIGVFQQIRKDYPHLKNNEICQAMGLSATTMRRIRKDLGVNSPFRYEVSSRKPQKKSVGEKAVEVQKPESVKTTNPKIKPRKNEIAGDVEEGDYLDKILRTAPKEVIDSDAEIDNLLQNATSRFTGKVG